MAGRPDGGLVLDTWRYFRSGAERDLLDVIPSEKIYSLQLVGEAAQP